MRLLEGVADGLWNPWLLTLFLVAGCYITGRSGCFQMAYLRCWLRHTLGSLLRPTEEGKRQGVSPLQALATALGSTIGTGSIAGVATAIFFGGPGAVFWMWVSAILGMMVGFAEKTLAVRYRGRDRRQGWFGGPMYYMRDGLRWRGAAAFFAAACAGSALLGGNMVQVNSMASALSAGCGWNRLAVGAAVAGMTALVIFGGVKRIAAVSTLLVPGMALLFLGGGLAVICCNLPRLPGTLLEIIEGAFRPAAAVGGSMGYGMGRAMRYGIARGVFTHEAGVGSSAIAHAAAETDDAAQQGMWGLFEVFVSTVLVCTVTALAILTSGAYDRTSALQALQSGAMEGQLIGAPLSMAAFASVLGKGGEVLVSVCLVLFAFTSILGWSYYGEQALGYLTANRWIHRGYRLVFLAVALFGSVGAVDMVWQLADICTGLMAAPNLLALCCLCPEAMEQLRRWTRERVGA